MKRFIAVAMVLVSVAFLAWAGYARYAASPPETRSRGARERAAPVEVADVVRGLITLDRVFTGTLTAHAEFVVAPKVGGRIVRLEADLADTVARDEIVAKLDDAEYVQAVAQAQADRAVATANVAEAEAQLRIARRELARVERLRKRGVTSESQLDTALAEQLAREAHLAVTRAQVMRVESELAAARIRLGYTEVVAGWPGGLDRRVVAERYVDEGETVSANAPLLRIVELDPVTAVFFVTERDYGLLANRQSASLTTDAFPDARFAGFIARISPVFRENTRQARVEVRVDNPESRLKPGLFVRITVELDRAENAVLVPIAAIVNRGEETGVFALAEDAASVDWRPVELGIRDATRVQITSGDVGRQVVVLGQQLLEDGSAVTLSDQSKPTGGDPGRNRGRRQTS